jgi:hypothetical protein
MKKIFAICFFDVGVRSYISSQRLYFCNANWK